MHQQSPWAFFNSPLQLRQKTTTQASNKINNNNDILMWT